ncbi:hypothetical protein CJ195_20105 [Bacillus sp. UMB0899]|uniref:hypothetical protein n=1 Tax=Metabacillus schmidteae TaxID=2730405 RepID=UPI000C801AAB|nr:hypothetical protein [Metabacillus schmidteae]PMC35101.1 hypothetical protein CJ195_20105 [Bacillus sp. UMB0899]
MNEEKTLLTIEEQALIERLENEMLFALTSAHIKFYKNEIQTIILQAKRRQALLSKYAYEL